MIVIASSNGDIGLPIAWDILRSGGSAIDAVEAATRIVEDNPDDHSVGYGGYPNLLGEVELDASIMDGTTLRAGAVGALRGYRHPLSVARRVREETDHVLLVGEGAARLAEAFLAEPWSGEPTPERLAEWAEVETRLASVPRGTRLTRLAILL